MERNVDDVRSHPGIGRIFLGWERPILETAVAAMLGEWGGGVYDFSALAVVVPTTEAGRKLRAALARQASQVNQAVLAPQIMTPEGVLAWAEPSGLLPASETESLLTWVEVLQEMDPTTVEQVFPKVPAGRDFAWALQMAAMFRRLQHALGEAGWSMAQATARFGADFPEAARWAELSSLERRYEAVLARSGLQDRNRALAKAALNVKVPAGVKKLWVFGVPDPLPLVRTAWDKLAERGLPITIYLQAPAALAAAFSDFGVPVPGYWVERPLPLTQPSEQIVLLPNPLAQAEKLLALTTAGALGELAVGVADREILPLAMTKFSERGIPAFNPEGVTFGEQSLAWMLDCWQELLAGRPWAAWAQWVRVPEVLEALLEECKRLPGTNPEATAATLLREADDCAALCLPHTIKDAMEALQRNPLFLPKPPQLSTLIPALQVTSRWLDRFLNEDFAIVLTDLLDRIYGDVEWPRDDPKTSAFKQASEHLLEKLGEVTRAAASLPNRLEPGQMLQLLLRLLREVHLFPEAPAEAVELSGWLELPWQTAPHLVVAGLNDGILPGAITADAWLPHGLRGLLNLRTNDERFACEAYRLTAMLEQRAATGSVRLLLGRASHGGDPLQPSRLLLLCPPEELPTRVRELFSEPPEDSQDRVAEWQRAWKLTPRLPEGWSFAKISATTFQKYLQCPFRYFLEMELRMQDYLPLKQEMDALDFGNLCHDTFEALAKDEIMSRETDATRVAQFLKDKAAERVRIRYGSSLSVPLIVQLRSIQQRLAAAAPCLVQSRLDGWEIRYVERNLRELLGAPWMIEGVEISGRIDMVEYHPQQEKWRIIDYKTSARPVTPENGHLTSAPKKERAAKPHEVGFIEAATLPDGRRWKNLQLPLYAAALQECFKQPVEVAYLNLPPATSMVRLEFWPELNEEDLPAHALKCAAAVIRCIKEAQFWPPNPRPDYESFARLWIDDIEDSFDPSELLADAAAHRAKAELVPT